MTIEGNVTKAASTAIDALVAQHALATKILAANTAGLSHDDSLVAPTGGGNCANWVIGHLVKARNDHVAQLGHARPFPPSRFERYGNGKPPLDQGEALPFEELNRSFAALHEPLVAALRAATPEALDTPVPNSPTGNPDETVGSFAAAIAFHEGYHLGQLALLRRTLGKPGLQ